LENPSDKSKKHKPTLDLPSSKVGQRLSIYIGESDRWRGKPLSMAILETLRGQGLAGATVYRGLAGFGAHSHIRTNTIEVLSMDLPIMVEVIDTPERIRKALDAITPMVREGLVTLEDVTIIKYTHRYLNPLPADRLVSDVMTKDVVSLKPDQTVRDAWGLMVDNALKAMPVIDESGKIVGMLTDEDLLDRAGIQQRLSITLKLDEQDIRTVVEASGETNLLVRDVMTAPVVTVTDEDSLGLASTTMVKAGLKRLPVVDDTGRLVGMLSRLDILRQVAEVTSMEEPRLAPPHAHQKIQDIMLKEIPTTQVDDLLPEIVDKLVKWNTHRLVVVDKNGKAVGMISDSDVVDRVQPEKRGGILNALRRIGKPPAGMETAEIIMSRGVTAISIDSPVTDAVRLMLAEGRKWLVVVDRQGDLVGLIDRRVLLQALVAGNLPKI
jgi:CBS-domain-containing membrane protein